MSISSRVVKIGQDPELLYEGPRAGEVIVTVVNRGNLVVWVGDPSVQPGQGAPLYPGATHTSVLGPGQQLWAARIPNRLGSFVVDWSAQVTVSTDQIGGTAGLVALRSNLSPKMEDQQGFAPGAVTYTAPITNMDDSLSFALGVNADVLGGNPCTVTLRWYVDEGLVALLWTEEFQVPPLGASDYLRIQGPVRGTWLSVEVTGTVTANPTFIQVVLFGLNQVLLVSRAQVDTSISITPSQVSELLPVTGGIFPGRTDASFQGNVVPVLAEASMSLNHLLGPGYAATAGSSFTVPAGKVLRIEAVHVTVNHTAAIAVQVLLRLTTAVTGNLIRRWFARTPGAGNSSTRYSLPNGLEFPAATVLQFSQVGSLAAGTLDTNLDGFLYDA